MQNFQLSRITPQRPLILVVLAISLFCQSRTCPASIFGEDDRVVGTPDDARFRPVGMVRENANFGFATAFLIDDCYALTAKHVIHHPNAIGRTVELRFEPWRRSKASNTTSGVVVAAGGASTAIADFSEDWALLRLDRCLGKNLGHFVLSTVSLKIMVDRPGITPGLISVGYPVDKKYGSGPTVDPRCEVKLITSYGLMHNCATLPGNSGGPLIGWNDDQRRFEVFAINVAGNHDESPRAFDLATSNVAVEVRPILAIVRENISGTLLTAFRQTADRSRIRHRTESE